MRVASSNQKRMKGFEDNARAAVRKKKKKTRTHRKAMVVKVSNRICAVRFRAVRVRAVVVIAATRRHAAAAMIT